MAALDGLADIEGLAAETISTSRSGAFGGFMGRAARLLVLHQFFRTKLIALFGSMP